MSSFTLLRFTQSAALNRSLIEQCLRQYMMCQARLYVIGNESRCRHFINGKERTSQKKALRIRILQDLKRTKRKVEKIIERENIWTVPNLLCMSRIVTSPFLSYLILSQDYQVCFKFDRSIIAEISLVINLMIQLCKNAASSS